MFFVNFPKPLCHPKSRVLWQVIVVAEPTPVFLPGKPHGRRSLVGYSPCAPHHCQKSARKRDMRMPGLDGCCAGLRASLPGGFPKPFHCHREESGNPGSLYFDRQNLGLGARALSLVSLNKHKYCLTSEHFLCPLYAIVYMQLPSRIPAPKQQRLASSAR